MQSSNVRLKAPMSLAIVVITITTLLVGNAVGKHILFYHPFGSYSHRVSVWPLVERLVENGHHVTFVSAYYPKHPLPNVTELVPDAIAKYSNDYIQGGELDVTRRISREMVPCYDHLRVMGVYGCELFLDDPAVIKWLQSEPKIDLFVVDLYVSECILGLAHKLKAPFIYYSPTVMVGITYETFGFVPDTAGIPDFEQHYTPPLTFWQRAVNMMQPLIWKFKMISYFEDLGEVVKTKMNITDLPPFVDLVRNASLVLWSESYIEGYPHVLPPNWIPVGGMHCKEKTNPLPKELEEIVQRGKDGFIYFSLGSAVVPGNLPRSYQDALLKGIGSFPNIQFLWKWTGEMLEKERIPPNLHIGTWFPQQDILAHKRIIAFITQAGRPSSQEAIFHGVPVIAMPVFEDQDFTAERVRDMGGGLVLEIATIKQSEFEDAIREISTNKKYKDTMKRLSQLFRDRPMHPTDTAYYWVEYVMRHNGNLDHFRTHSHHLTWYERRHLDVWTAIILAVMLAVGIPIYIVLYILEKLCSNGEDSSSQNGKPKKSKKVRRKDD